jgi:serine/threonine protein kinase
MPRHHVAFFGRLPEFISLASEGWQEMLCRDIQDGGQMRTYPLPANAYGKARVGVLGRQYAYEICPDRNREDTIFVYHIQSLRLRSKDRNATLHAVDLKPLLQTGVAPASLDPVDYLFGDIKSPTLALSMAEIRPSRKALELIGSAITDLEAWRPRIVERRPVADFLAPMVAVWKRFKLGRLKSIGPREQILLSGAVPSELDEVERQRLRMLFDLSLINSFASNTSLESQFADFMSRIAEIDLLESVRCSVWATRLSRLNSEEIRRELHASHAALTIVAQESVRSEVWSGPTLKALETAATRNTDVGIADVVRAAEVEANTLGSIALWAAKLAFDDRVAAEVTPVPPSMSSAERPHQIKSEVALENGLTANAIAIWLEDQASIALLEYRRRADALNAALGEAPPRMDSCSSLSWAMQYQAYVDHLDELARLTIDACPDFDDLASDAANASRIAQRAAQAMGPSLNGFLQENPGVAAEELSEIADLIARLDDLIVLPSWVWTTNFDERPPSTKLDIAKRIRDEQLRDRLTLCLELLDRFGKPGREIVSTIPPPPAASTETFEQYFRQQLEQRTWNARRLESVPDKQRKWVMRAIEEGDSDGQVLELVDRLGITDSQISADCFDIVLSRLCEEKANRPAIVALAEQSIQVFSSMLGALDRLPSQVMSQWLDHQLVSAAKRGTKTQSVSLAHNWTDKEGARAPLTWRPHPDPNTPYGYVSAPLVIQSSVKAPLQLGLDVQVSRRLQKGERWPSEWDSASPDSLVIDANEWRQDGRWFSYSFEMTIPVRRPTENESLEVSITMNDDRGSPLIGDSKFRWDVIEPEHKALSLEWARGIRPEFVVLHPIGPQKRAPEIDLRVQASASFAVIAPRRFGKSTLVEFVKERSVEMGLVCPRQVVCTSFPTPEGGVDHAGIWKRVSDDLLTAVGASLEIPIGPLPSIHGFDHVRRAAKNKGYKAILILIDEAQLFFPATSGTAVGDALKDALEGNWGRLDSKEMVPILFGLVGLPRLNERAGVNLINFLQPFSTTQIGEADLNRIILSVTRDRLHTTREAREEITAASVNLYVAQVLVSGLIERLNERQRRWANVDDVRAVEAQIIDDLRQGRHDEMGGLVRDALNLNPSVNKWEPIPSYPVALAMALARHEGARGGSKLVQSVVQRLNAWCELVDVGPSTRLQYHANDVERHLNQLDENEVMVDREFRSEFLEAWLVGQGRRPLSTIDQECLIRGAVQVVDVPQGTDWLEQGGQADIGRATIDGVLYAVRRMRLPNALARNRFMESIQAVRQLSNPNLQREAGYQYFFQVASAGFGSLSEMEGVQIYRWIDGEDLRTREGQMDPRFVVDVGYKLAVALRLLHRHDILHRDISPRNIILSDVDRDPVLIDFGMARLASAGLKTAGEGPYCAPETRDTVPRWSRASDVFALGATLSALLVPGGSVRPELERALSECINEDPNCRPEVSDLLGQFETLRALYGVDEIRSRYWQRIRSEIEVDRGKRWYLDVIEKFRATFESGAVGGYSDDFERCVDTANFLNQILESIPVGSGKQLTLGYVKNTNPDTGNNFANSMFEMAFNLRLYRAHGTKKNTRRQTLQRAGNPNSTEMKTAIMNVATAIGSHFDLPSLVRVVNVVLT